ncbi:MAG: acetoacetate--CoA ligase [Saprospiraceae bacterium]|nr:acetoacetate--CoA ligase [Saprospiraceae bacterium]
MPSEEIIWRPSPATIANARLTGYRTWLKERHGMHFQTYHDLWQWSVEHIETFWESIWEYFGVDSSAPYDHVLQGKMPDAQWFAGARINYAQHIFRNATDTHPAVMFKSERHPLTEISWEELTDQVARLRTFLRRCGVQPGDRVAAYVPNIPEATVGFLAACSLGAVWSSCSPDFGADSVIDRFAQIEPKVLICVDGYQYGGKSFDKMDVVRQIARQLPSVEKSVLIPYLDPEATADALNGGELWDRALAGDPEPLAYAQVPFDHPIWVLYSSGTTGVPKAITHSHGGMLLEHLKYLAFHNDVHRGERFFWFSTTGWMMWNYVQAAMLHGATIVLYDGSPGYPDLDVLWRLVQDTGMEHFGTSAPFLIACMKAGLSPKMRFDFSRLRSVSSTGAPLPPEAFDWVFAHVDSDICLWSMSGGTDVCTAFVGGCPELPLHRGEIQCRALGCALYAYNPAGEPVVGEVGEMVITRPMPSMPVFFWNDPGKQRYRASYFDHYPGIWRHGDWVEISPHGGLTMYGRSDATLNRQGVRIGTAEIYRALHGIEAVRDALIVHLDERDYMPLFVVLNPGYALDADLRKEIKATLRQRCSPRHVPDEMIAVADIPYTISGKKMEAPVKKILSGQPVTTSLNRDAMRNPEAMDFFIAMAGKL